MAISKQMNYCSSEGFTYSLKNELDDKTLNCVEVLRTNQFHQKLNIIDNSEIIIYEPDEYSSVVGMFSVSWNDKHNYVESVIHISSKAIESLEYGRYLYIHELTHKLLHQNGFEGASHGGHFLTVLCALLIRAFGENGWKKATLYDYHDSIREYDSISDKDSNPIERFDLFTLKMLAVSLAMNSKLTASGIAKFCIEQRRGNF